MSIPQELIPVHALEMVRDAEKFSVTSWRVVVRNWPLVTIKFALVARMQNEEARVVALRKGADELDRIATSGSNDNDSSLAWAALFCLSDAALCKALFCKFFFRLSRICAPSTM